MGKTTPYPFQRTIMKLFKPPFTEKHLHPYDQDSNEKGVDISNLADISESPTIEDKSSYQGLENVISKSHSAIRGKFGE